MWRYVCSNELYHYGVKGMKWGVRKAEEETGSNGDRKKKVKIAAAVLASTGAAVATAYLIKSGKGRQLVKNLSRKKVDMAEAERLLKKQGLTVTPLNNVELNKVPISKVKVDKVPISTVKVDKAPISTVKIDETTVPTIDFTFRPSASDPDIFVPDPVPKVSKTKIPKLTLTSDVPASDIDTARLQKNLEELSRKTQSLSDTVRQEKMDAGLDYVRELLSKNKGR